MPMDILSPVPPPDPVVLPHFSTISGRQTAELSGNALARETIRENNIRNHRVAAFMQDRDSHIANRLRECHSLIQRKGNYHQASLCCRVTQLCANCHVVRSRYTQERFSTAATEFASQQGIRTKLMSYVLHPVGDPSLPLELIADVIGRFGRRLEQQRCRQNSRTTLKRELLGPVLLSSHLQPAAKFNAPGGFRLSHADKMHLHILLTVHDRALARDVQTLLEKTWEAVQYSDSRKLDINLKRSRLDVEDAQHEANLIAYLARHIKPVWNPRQVIQAYDLANKLSRSSLYRVLGAPGEVRKLPRRSPLIGDALRFNPDTLDFDSVFLSKWT